MFRLTKTGKQYHRYFIAKSQYSLTFNLRIFLKFQKIKTGGFNNKIKF
jgi:hypothetical protein